MTRVVRSGLWRYGGAVVIVALATWARQLLDPVLGDNTPFLTYFPAVALVAWGCGSGPTLLSVFLSALSAVYFFLAPRYSIEIHRQSDQIALAIFVGCSLVTAALSEQVRRARQRAERRQQQLQDERERWQITLASVGDAVLVTDARGTITFLNGVAETLTGWPQAEAAGRPLNEVFQIIGEGNRQPAANPVARVIQTGTIQGLANHTLLIARDGHERAIADSAAPIRRGEEMLGVVLVFRDVTPHREQERRLQESEARFAAFVDYAPAVIFIKDTTGGYLLVNSMFERLAGIERDRLLGLSDEAFFPPDVAERFGQVDRRVLASGQAETFEEAFAYGGQAFTFLTTKFPLLDAEGRTYAICGIATDITERKRAQDALQEADRSKAELLALLDTLQRNAPIGFAFVDRQFRYVRINEALAAINGKSVAEHLGRTIAETIPALWPRLEPLYHGVLEGRPAVNREFTGESPAAPGDIRHWLLSYYPVRIHGEVAGVGVVVIDVTERKRAEKALRESEAKFRALYEMNFIGVGFWEAGGGMPEANDALIHMLGYTRAEFEGGAFNWRAATPEEYRAADKRALAQMAAGATHFTPFEKDFYRKDGSRLSVLLGGALLPGYQDRGFSFLVDLTARRQAEQALRASEEKLRLMADAMPQIVWTARPDGTIDYLNRQWHEFTGLPTTLGNAGWAQILHPDDAVTATARWTASIQSGAAFQMELRLLDRRRQTYRWHLVRTVAVHEAPGKVARWFGTATDIDEQKRAEESARYLAEASAALASVVDYESTLQKVANLAVPYFADWSAVDVANDDGSLRRLAVAHQDPDKISLAHELMREYPPDPQAPSGALAVLRTGKPEILGAIPDELLVQGARDERHLRLIRSLGLKSYICVPLVVSGKPLGVLTFVTAESGRRYADADLTLATDLAHRAAVAIENTQLYQALREADRRKDEFLATLAHELRNPLAPIRNALQILKMPRVDAGTIERSRDMMERQVNQLVRLVDDLLDVSRVMRGKIELRKGPVELAVVIARAVETVQPLIDVQGHALSVHLPPGSMRVDADAVRLAQVVGNLLTNAAKYTEANGHIWLSAQPEDGQAVLRIRDTGIGIAPDMLPHVFELFVQVDHAATRSQGGLGIGLTLVRNLVEMHHGTVEVHSAGLGQGCEFVVRLPLMVPEQEPPIKEPSADSPPAPPSAASPSAGRRLLIVDDNRDAADSLAMLLRLQGHEVQVAHDGPAALEVAQGYRPEMVFLDIGMPGMDGYEVARRMRQQIGLENVVLTALTGWGQQEDRRRSREAGFDHHLVKPPEPKAVEKLLADLKPARA